MDRAARAGFRAKIASENVASGQKSFSDAMYYWERSSGHRENLLRSNVSAAGVAMAQAESGRAYWTVVLGAE
ncbi:Cysteine-rich secretory protein family protein [compost metagenome]